MDVFLNYSKLNKTQLDEYRKALSIAFPAIIRASLVGKKFWPKLEKYFPEFQLFLTSPSGEVLGFINTIPFQFNKPLSELPDRGWDWMLEKGILGFEKKEQANFLGGLQVIIIRKFQKMGYSKLILEYAKQFYTTHNLQRLIIPIRPTLKHAFPNMSMLDYIHQKSNNQIYDPWIRTHLNSGAEIIKICHESMTISGNISFWENIIQEPLNNSGYYFADGALSPVKIDLKNNSGIYKEANIWINYS